MGGCNSIAADVMTLGLAELRANKGCQKDKSALIQATNEIIATAIVSTITENSSNLNSLQEIEITCNPSDLKQYDPFPVYEMNPSCRQCYSSVFDGMKVQHDLERKMWEKEKDDEIKVKTPIDEEYKLLLQRLTLCGITTCKACALLNITQVNMINQDSQGYSNFDINGKFKLNLQSLIQQQLINNQDVLSGVVKAFANPELSSISETISSRITSQTDQTFFDSLMSDLKSSQVIQIKSAGNISGNNMHQYSIYTQTLQKVSSNEITTKAINEGLFDEIAQIANQQNTLNSIGDVVFQGAEEFVKVLSGVVGKIMFAVFIGLGVIVFVIVILLIAKQIKKSIKKREKEKSYNPINF